MRFKATLFRLSGSNACKPFCHVLIVLCIICMIPLLGHSSVIASGGGPKQDTSQNKRISKQGNDATKAYKQQLELEKLELEIKKLSNQGAWQDFWEELPIPVKLMGVILPTFGAYIVARRQILGARDQAVHEARLKAYPKLVRATASLAIYFPDTFQLVPIGPKDCATMGRKLSAWYFQHGGLLLSRNSRSAYFRLATALTRASKAPSLHVPPLQDYGLFSNKEEQDKYLSKDRLDEYRTCLEEDYGINVRTLKLEDWKFGGEDEVNPRESCVCTTDAKKRAWKFRDYIVLQQLSSLLRTELTKDLRSREKPI